MSAVHFLWITGRQRLPRTLLGALLLILFMPLVKAETFTESQVKAVYLYNFANFVRWPETSFQPHPEEFHFCSSESRNEVVQHLQRLTAGETINGRRLVVRTLDSGEPPLECQLLFVSDLRTETGYGQIPGLLLVSDQENFVASGGIIELRTLNSRIRPLIQVDQLDRAGLSASSQLLRLSDRQTD